jgi:hypothetical protein
LSSAPSTTPPRTALPAPGTSFPLSTTSFSAATGMPWSDPSIFA